MGNKIGLDFRGGAEPVPFVTALTGIDNEGCASVCDSTGKFLFYTNGNKVWDSLGAIMPNGAALPGYSSATQGALIVPKPGDYKKYYVFTLNYGGGFQKLHCNLVNMNLQGGLGDVDTTFYLNNVVLTDSLAEKMVAVQGCNKDLWVIVHGSIADVFYAFNISVSGINLTPVISSFPNSALYIFGVMKGSPLGNKILICSPGLKTYDFDGSTGVISSPATHDFDSYYGGTFSPDGSKIYGLTFGFQSHLYQFDLSAPNPSATKTLLDTTSVVINYSLWEDLKLAPDGKIYFGPVNEGRQHMGRINYPDLQGLACGYQNVVSTIDFAPLGPDKNIIIGLPNEVVLPALGGSNIFKVALDTSLCTFPFTQGFTLSAPSGHSGYRWDDNSYGSHHTVFQPGVYWVRYNTGHCNFITDTFYVRPGVPVLSILFSNNTLSTTQPYTNYQWYYQGQAIAGANSQQLIAVDTGWYSVKVDNGFQCSDSSGYYVGSITGIADPDHIKGQITVFPNPAKNIVSVEAPLPVSITLIDVFGKLLSGSQSNSMDISSYANGLYFVYVRDRTGNLITIKKIIISR